MLNGGYHIVDFKDINIDTTNGAVITGIYESFEDNPRKAIMVSGVTIDNVQKNDCFVDCEVNDGSFVFTAYGKTFTVSNEDKVTIA